jgi:hypothetical protein
VPPTREELAQWCGEAEDMAHCGRLIEQQQMKRLPGLARREGVNLRIALFPTGSATFADVENPLQQLSYSLFDSIDAINAVLLFKTDGEKTTFVLLQRAGNRSVELPVRARAVARPPAPRDRGLLRDALRQRARRVARDARGRRQGARVALERGLERRDAALEGRGDRRRRLRHGRRRHAAHARAQALARRLAHAALARVTVADAPNDVVRRPVRSYVLRQGRLSPAQARALAELAPRYAIPFAHAPLDFATTFGRRADVVLEIGCGMGETTAGDRGGASRPSISSGSRCTRPAWARSSTASRRRACQTCA